MSITNTRPRDHLRVLLLLLFIFLNKLEVVEGGKFAEGRPRARSWALRQPAQDQVKRARKKWRMSGNCSTICGAGSSSLGSKGTGSTICCTVRRCTRSCGPDKEGILSGRAPPGSSSMLKRSGWGVGGGGGGSRIVAV